MATQASSLINDARGFTAVLTGQASNAMNDAISMVRAVGYVVPGAVVLNLPAAPFVPALSKAPVLQDVALVLPTQPGAAPVYQDIGAIVLGLEPDKPGPAPALVLPSAPNQLSAFTVLAPSIDLSAQFPTAPSLIMPEAPVLRERPEPVAPKTALPVFDARMPDAVPSAPTDLQSAFSNAYREASPGTITMVNGYVDAMMSRYNPRYAEQMGRIENQLATYLDGGTGLKPAVEDAIYARAREKNDVEANRVRDTAYGEAASRGFTLPAGVLMSAVARARQEAANNNLKAASDIVVMQAEMEQKNLQFAVTTSAGLRTTMLNAALSYMQNLSTLNAQALDYAKSTMGAIVEMYNISVRAYSAKLEAYKAEATVFEVRLKSALAAADLYRLEIAALESLTQVDSARVAVYRSRIDVLTSMTAMYRTQVEAVVSRASLEKLKLDVFQAQVSAFGAQVSAKNSEWQGYTAAIGGESAKVQAYGAQVQAYSAQMQGFKTSVEAKSEVVRAQTATNEARARQYTAALTGYQTVVQAVGEVARTKIENQRQQIIAFQAETQAVTANAQVQNEFYKATSNVAIENARLRLTAQIQTAESTRGFGESLARLGTANATIYGNLAGAALSGMNALAVESASQ